jgi:hypothetical protein
MAADRTTLKSIFMILNIDPRSVYRERNTLLRELESPESYKVTISVFLTFSVFAMVTNKFIQCYFINK